MFNLSVRQYLLSCNFIVNTSPMAGTMRAYTIASRNVPVTCSTKAKYSGPPALAKTMKDWYLPWIAPRWRRPKNAGIDSEKTDPMDAPESPSPRMLRT